MDIQTYTKRLFDYGKVDITSVTHLKNYLEEKGYNPQNKDLTVIIPDRNEDPRALQTTLLQIAFGNFMIEKLEGVEKEKFRINKIIVSDQSDDEILEENRGIVYVTKDILKETFKHDIPELYHFPLDEEMTGIVYEYLKDHLKLSKEYGSQKLLGKGMNMFLSSLTESLEDSESKVLLFFDAENEEIKHTDSYLLGAPIIYEGSPILFTKAAFRRYHMEKGRRKLGGRVNASLGVPLINMFIYGGLFSIEKPIIYPLSGEIGIRKDVFDSIKIAKKYGVEVATLIQLLKRDEDVNISPENFLQVYLGMNMDQPLAEGKSKSEILAGVKKMSEDILKSTEALMDKPIREIWGLEEFLNIFKEFQKESMKKWKESHDNTQLITGGIRESQLREVVEEVVEGWARELYHENGVWKRIRKKFTDMFLKREEEFIPPISQIKDDLGGKFYDLVERLSEKRERIHPK